MRNVKGSAVRMVAAQVTSGSTMPTEHHEAARAIVKRHRLPRSRSKDGKTLAAIDLKEIRHMPALDDGASSFVVFSRHD